MTLRKPAPSSMASGFRYASLVASIFLVCGVFTLLRTDGITGAGDSLLAWRWTPTPEQRLLAQAGDDPAAPVSTPAAAVAGAALPRFRGPPPDGRPPPRART